MHPPTHSFTARPRRDAEIARLSPSVVYIKRYSVVMVIGGKKLSTVSLYFHKKNKWDELYQELNCRKGAPDRSACVVGDMVYVVGASQSDTTSQI